MPYASVSEHASRSPSLGLGAFSGVMDLLHACTKALDAWKSLHEMDDDIRLIRTRLMVQKESLEYWDGE